MRGALVLLIGVTVPAAAAAGPALQPIIGGTPTEVGDFPTVVAVELGGNALCTGTLIHPRWVLTAAHCVDPAVVGVGTQEQVTAATSVRFDSVTAFTQTGRLIRAARTIPHPGFVLDQLGDDDIGLIELAEAVDDRMVSRVNRSAAAAPIGISVTLVGYGRDATGTHGREYYLGDHTSISCGAFGESDGLLLCFDQTDGEGQCQGDSGGPSFAMIDGIQTVTGITSFGDRDCAFFGAQSRVDAEIAFADEHIGRGLQCVHDGACAFGCAGLDRDADCPRCDDDDACAEGQVCDAGGTCVPAPMTPGGLGATCANDGECATGICLSDGVASVCTQACNDEDDCGDDFDCIEGPSSLVCWPGGDGGGGGCAASGNAAGGAAALLLALAAALLRPRSRRAARARGSRA